MKSFLAKAHEVERNWRIVDADGAILGRMAVKIAEVLMGKTKCTYTPHVDTGDFVIVINAEKIRVSGNKAATKEYDHYTGFPGGRKIVTFAELLKRKPEKIIEMAVRRMLPKNKLGRGMIKKLKVYRGSEHNHAAQKPEPMTV